MLVVDDDRAAADLITNYIATDYDVEGDGERQASGQGTVPPAEERDDPFRYGFPGIGLR